jgi:uroporphyrinogen decarboxylase
MTKFNKQKRLEAAIAGEKVDRLPVALWRHWPGDDQDAQALAAAHISWQKAYDWDFVKVSPSSSYAIHDWGVESVWEGNIEGTRTYTRRAVTNPAGWAELPLLDPSDGMLAVQIEALRLIGEAFGSETPFLTTIFSPLSQAKNISGGEAMLSHMRQDPDAFQAGLQTITQSTLRFIDAARKTGISGIYYAIQHNRYNLMSPVEYQIFGQPYDEEILSFVNDLMMNVVHVHGEGAYLDIVADYPVEVVNWHDREAPADLAAGLKQIIGAANGGVSRWSMLQESPEGALAEAIDAVQQTGGKRFILGTGCVIMVTTPTRNIRALRDFVENS